MKDRFFLWQEVPGYCPLYLHGPVIGFFGVFKKELGVKLSNFSTFYKNNNARFYFKEKEFKHAAFNLHQSVENFYKTVLLVYTNYKPKTHKLDKLSKMAGGHDPAFFKIFPMGTDEERRRFDLLKQAYVGARYDPKYIITAE